VSGVQSGERPALPGAAGSSGTGQVVSRTWDAALLATAEGSAVELRVVGHASTDLGDERAVEVGAVAWNAAYAAAGPELYFLRARYYDPTTGRFVSRDLLELNQRYAYVGNNPLIYTDLLGLCRGSWNPLDWGDCVLDAADTTRDAAVGTAGFAWDTAVGAHNLARNGLDATIANDFGSDCAFTARESGVTFHFGCSGQAESFLLGARRRAVTVGTDVFTYRTELSEPLKRHEACHVGQYDRFGDAFLFVYMFRKEAFEEAARWTASNTTSIASARRVCSGTQFSD
jgi:RHS repeat-associated protein